MTAAHQHWAMDAERHQRIFVAAGGVLGVV